MSEAEKIQQAYKEGFIDGVKAYAWWKDGAQQVGTTGRTLRQAVEEVEKTWNYDPLMRRT